ncbi:hypothetical protein QMK19_18120 [Streptomyces sp. H10-C2]|uniref:hypothetical protein n=1 Tax=unclassified Streptomyces TaxID=2593676 RepID=UPI0024BA8BAF|nr:MULTISPECIES: hypothetical protein [unclassified Streptomyces]MDJ0343469.1 hypothetical protein [Streptomyces sp. PH10-H1]MDJ0371549.1 hypothetical protein [Streptomyces sp. H10-C2]
MNAGSVVRRTAVTVGALVGASTLVLGGSGVASAETAGNSVTSKNCTGTMMTQYVAGGGGWQVRNYVNNSNGSVNCSGWMDWAPDGNTGHFYGLQNRIYVDRYNSQESTYLPDNSPALTRVCVQASDDGSARCSAWW